MLGGREEKEREGEAMRVGAIEPREALRAIDAGELGELAELGESLWRSARGWTRESLEGRPRSMGRKLGETEGGN